ncbi:MAG: hypothetical protein EBR82_69710 [Caulobacteraceae bacterium]|nr:hypothetical protein [Caulobacteraceae bacterium]
MEFNLRKAVAFVMIVIAWILLTFFFIGCASVNKVQEKEGWFPTGMDEDSQSFYNSRHNDFYNSKYNMMDTPDGSRGNSDIKVFRLEY